MINSSDLTLSAIGTDIKRKSADALILGVLKNGESLVHRGIPFHRRNHHVPGAVAVCSRGGRQS